jgi:hypothetical protein
MPASIGNGLKKGPRTWGWARPPTHAHLQASRRAARRRAAAAGAGRGATRAAGGRVATAAPPPPTPPAAPVTAGTSLRRGEGRGRSRRVVVEERPGQQVWRCAEAVRQQPINPGARQDGFQAGGQANGQAGGQGSQPRQQPCAGACRPLLAPGSVTAERPKGTEQELWSSISRSMRRLLSAAGVGFWRGIGGEGARGWAWRGPVASGQHRQQTTDNTGLAAGREAAKSGRRRGCASKGRTQRPTAAASCQLGCQLPRRPATCPSECWRLTLRYVDGRPFVLDPLVRLRQPPVPQPHQVADHHRGRPVMEDAVGWGGVGCGGVGWGGVGWQMGARAGPGIALGGGAQDPCKGLPPCCRGGAAQGAHTCEGLKTVRHLTREAWLLREALLLAPRMPTSRRLSYNTPAPACSRR